jgi:ubiquinone/menaquinone biosynthesis C-methylase UbiE
MTPSFLPSGARGLFGGPLDEARVRAYWDSMGPCYALHADHGLVRFSHKRQHGAVLRLAPVAHGARVLDAGAGSGLLTRRLVERGCDVTAVDASPAMLDQLRGVTPNVILSRLEDLRVPAAFDAVMAIGVLNFVTTPEDTLRRLCDAVKPGGALVLQVTEWTAFGLTYWLNYRFRGFRPFLFTRAWLTERTREQGFEPAGHTHPLPHDLTIAFRKRPQENTMT